MKITYTLAVALFSSLLLTTHLVCDEVVDGSRTIDGNLTVNGDLTVTGDLVVHGRIISLADRGDDPVPREEFSDIFVELWRLDQQRNGLSVTLRDSDGRWEDESAEIRLDEQDRSTNPSNDGAPSPMLLIHDDSKLDGASWQAVQELFDNYNAHEAGQEDEVGNNQEEDDEIESFLNAILATDVMQRSLEYINQEGLHGQVDDLTLQAYRELLKRQWFELYTNHFSTAKSDNSGFEHVFVGDHNGQKIGGHHFWWKFFIDQEQGSADSLGHNYKGPQGDRYPWIATFRMRWSPEQGTNLVDPDQKGFFVGCSPELMIAYGTLGLLMEKQSDGDHPVVVLDGGRFELTIHANTLPGQGDPDDRRGDQIKSAFPKLQSVAASGPGLDITVAEAFGMSIGPHVQVVGLIADAHNEQFGMRLADAIDSPQFLAVKLPKTFRSQFNPKFKSRRTWKACCRTRTTR